MRERKSMSLLIRNLRYTTSPERIRKYFERFGEVKDVYLPLDYYTKLPRGFGFVEFAQEQDAEVALQATSRNVIIDSSEVSVTVAQQGRKSPDTMRHKERARYRRSYSSDRRRSSPPYRRSRSRSYMMRKRSRRSDSSGYYRFEDEDRSNYRRGGRTGRYRSPPRYQSGNDRRRRRGRTPSVEIPEKRYSGDEEYEKRDKRHYQSLSPGRDSSQSPKRLSSKHSSRKRSTSHVQSSKRSSPALSKHEGSVEKRASRSCSPSESYVGLRVHEDDLQNIEE